MNVPVKNDVLSQRRATFRQLHRGRCFVMPNPWDVGSARYLEQAGFPALATTSGGFAFSRGLPDSEAAVSRERMLQHIADIVAAVDVPVSADFASCYGIRPEDVEDSVERCIATGIAGLSMEDASGDPASPLYDPSLAVARVQAARRAIDRSGSGVVLTARTECFRLGHPDAFRESIRRLQAYSEAGADVLFAPGVRLPNQIQVLVEAVRPKPLHLLVSGNIGLDVEDIAALGVRRISVGSALALAAWAGMMRAAKTLRNLGSFAGFDDSVSFARMNEFLTADLESRRLAGEPDMTDGVRRYLSPRIVVTYEARRCIHAAKCLRGLPEVFDTKRRPWVLPTAASPDATAAVVNTCPSGALHYIREDGGPAEVPDEENTIVPKSRGPLFVRGSVELRAADGSLIVEDVRLALCRCGQSQNKPFCDNSHRASGFDDPGVVAEGGEPFEAHTKLTITAQKNGPLLAEGSLVVRSDRSAASHRTTRVELCRCGGSSTKPFCDGTHETIGFRSE